VRRAAGALIALLVIVTSACGGGGVPRSIAVGSSPDTESVLIAHLYAAALRFYGSAAHVEQSQDPLIALDAGDVSVVPGFTGRILARFAPDATARAPAQVYRDMVSALPEGVVAGDYTESAEDKPALAVTDATAAQWGGRDLSAAVRHCDSLRPGQVVDAAPPTVIGTCKLPRPREYADAAALFAALKAGRINGAWTTTAAPNIPLELLTLSDRTSLIRAENLVPLYRRNELNEQQVLALNEVGGVLDTAALAEMRARVAEGTDPGAVATAFIDEHPLGD